MIWFCVALPACPNCSGPAVEASGALAKVLSREEVATTVMPAVVQCSQDKSWRVRYNAVQQASHGQPCISALAPRLVADAAMSLLLPNWKAALFL